MNTNININEFKDFVEQAFNHELKMLKELPNMSMYDQAAHDQNIHKKVILKGVFDDIGNDFLAKDIKVKELFKKVLKQVSNNEIIDSQDKIHLIKMLKKDQKSHNNYILNFNFSKHTGSEEWHKMWIAIYSKWINWLEKL